jgi:multimeric flavodoxin WrbA
MQEQKLALVLFGSPRKNGYTARMLHTFEARIAPAYRIVRLNAYELRAEPCIGCGYCEKTEGCRYRDLDQLDSLLRSADLLVVATPVYNLSFPSPLKAIFDRMQRYFSARFSMGIRPPISKHKKAMLLLTCGADSDEGLKVISRQLQMTFTVINAELTQTVLWKNTDREGEDVSALHKAASAAETVLEQDLT